MPLGAGQSYRRMTATLVTGAAGFIGLNLVEALLVKGNDVVAFDTLYTAGACNTGIRGAVRPAHRCRR